MKVKTNQENAFWMKTEESVSKTIEKGKEEKIANATKEEKKKNKRPEMQFGIVCWFELKPVKDANVTSEETIERRKDAKKCEPPFERERERESGIRCTSGLPNDQG